MCLVQRTRQQSRQHWRQPSRRHPAAVSPAGQRCRPPAVLAGTWQGLPPPPGWAPAWAHRRSLGPAWEPSTQLLGQGTPKTGRLAARQSRPTAPGSLQQRLGWAALQAPQRRLQRAALLRGWVPARAPQSCWGQQQKRLVHEGQQQPGRPVEGPHCGCHWCCRRCCCWQLVGSNHCCRRVLQQATALLAGLLPGLLQP